MLVDLFDFKLPETHIALRPVVPRDAARLLGINQERTPCLSDHIFSELPDLLRAGDLLVFNDARVIPAQLTGRRLSDTHDVGAKIKVTLHQHVAGAVWRAFVRPAKRLSQGDKLIFTAIDSDPSTALIAEVIEKADRGEVVLLFDRDGIELDEVINALGSMPLPPYIASQRDIDAADLVDYQTIYARYPGAVASPTAGLHFTQHLFDRLAAKKISSVFVTLHVGAGTFLPVITNDTDDHRMYSERGVIDAYCVEKIKQTRRDGGRIVAVGTTVLRLLESAVDEKGQLYPFNQTTDIFISPGYNFCVADLLITNFHLPRSTLFMLVSAFAGFDRMKMAYQHAIAQNYRFYSYGDACLLYRV